MNKTNKEKIVSNCCKSTIKLGGGDEGTFYYVCLKCNKGCDAFDFLKKEDKAHGIYCTCLSCQAFFWSKSMKTNREKDAVIMGGIGMLIIIILALANLLK